MIRCAGIFSKLQVLGHQKGLSCLEAKRNLCPQRNIHGWAKRLKKGRIFANDLVVKVGDVTRANANHKSIWQCFIWCEIASFKPRVVVEVE